jgi:hypothetical protein
MHSVDLKKTSTSVRTIRFDDGRLKIEDIVDIAEGSASVALSEASQFRSAIARGAAFLDRLLREEGTIYGVSTGMLLRGQVFTFAVLLRFALTKLDIVFFEGQESL